MNSFSPLEKFDRVIGEGFFCIYVDMDTAQFGCNFALGKQRIFSSSSCTFVLINTNIRISETRFRLCAQEEADNANKKCLKKKR